MELDFVRKELNKYDAAIKNLMVLRMSLIPIVADIKIKNDLPLFQAKREEEIYKEIEIFAKKNGINENLVKDVYKIIIANALKMEEDIAENAENSIINKKVKDVPNSIEKNFKKLDTILEKDIPNIIFEIQNSLELEGLPLLDKATLYYHEKIDRKEI